MAAGVVLLALPAIAQASVQRAGGIDYVTKGVTLPSSSVERVKANCPAGTHVIGGGERNGAPYDTVKALHLYPVDLRDRDSKPDDGWGAMISNAGSKRSAKLTAICAKPKPRYRKRTFTANPNDQTGEEDVACPSDRHAFSGGENAGASVADNSGFPIDGADPDSEPDDGWGVYVDNFANAPKQVTEYAICGEVLPTYPEADDVVAASSQSAALDASCPANTHVYGGGQANNAGFDGISVNSAAPFGSGAPDDGWRVRVDDVSSIFPFTYESDAICGEALHG